MAKELLPDELWQEIEPLLPPRPPPSPRGGRPPGGAPPSPGGGGPPVDDRDALRGVLFVLKTGIPWQALPTETFDVSGSSCWRRLPGGGRAGGWAPLRT